ncbi:MAG: hypothetical protein ACK56I_20285, partial [bacterium]
MEGKPMPSLALSLSKIATSDDLAIELDSQGQFTQISYQSSGRKIPTSPNGVMEVNFRGPSYTFPYVSARQLLDWDPLSEKTKTIALQSLT